VIRRLQTQFIPFAGNTHELQNGRNLHRDWFMKAAATTNPRILNNVTAQGFYVMGADGSTYGFNNNRSIERVLGFLEKGRNAFLAAPKAAVSVSDEELRARFSRTADPSVSIMRVYTRIKPLPEGCAESNASVGRDHFWIYPEDVQAILAATEKKGERASMPQALVTRLARYHLVDNIRGEPDFWRAEEVRKTDLRVWFVRSSASIRTVAFAGDFSLATSSGARGLEGKLEGEIELDASTSRVARMRVYGASQAWGAGTYTPNPPAGRFPLLFAIVDARDEYAKSTPPQAAQYGDGEYRKPR
jgi:hypothetical protein